jgi:uncharacterized membrane protein (DUF485 family)
MAQPPPTTDDVLERRKIAIGIQMTILYSIVYGGFVVLSVFQPTWMGARAVLGLNLAVAYGIGLIIAAVLFALVYNYLCRVPPTSAASQPSTVSGPEAGQRES